MKQSGVLKFNSNAALFVAEKVPASPYREDGKFHPYPVIVVEARDGETNEVLITTRMTAPISSEMGCKNCHGGDWRFDHVAGISDDTAKDVLAVHDRISQTDLLKSVLNGNPHKL